MEEIWKDIPEYFGIYKVSSLGRVKSLERKVKCRNGSIHTIREKILKFKKCRDGYLYIILCKEGKRKHIAVHRLVAEVFLKNTYNLPEVNHLDECKTNNNVTNLEWITREKNLNYGTRNERIAKAHTGVYNTKRSKAVMCIETGKIYPSTAEVHRQLGFAQQSICHCCNGKLKTAYKFHWKWAD